MSDNEPDEFQCTAKDLDYLSCSLVVLDDDVLTCSCGDVISLKLQCVVENGTGSNRGVAYVAGQLEFSTGSCPVGGGSTSCDVGFCEDELALSRNVPTSVDFEEIINWPCGSNVNFVDVVLGSKPTGSYCNSTSAAANNKPNAYFKVFTAVFP